MTAPDPDWPLSDPAVADALTAALRDGSWGKYHGGHVERLEAELAAYLRAESVQTCASGTLAVEVALRAVGVEAGDEVIVPAYDYEGNFLCVHAVGATPVLVDVAANGCLDPHRIAEAASPRTRAVLASHLHGGLVPMPELMTVAGRHGLRVVEDAAQATGAVVAGKRAGTWGDAGVLSFGGSKLLTAGRGGAVVTSNPHVQQKVRLILRRGVQSWAALSELQAAVLVPQLARLDERNATRLDRVRQILGALADLPGLRPLADFGASNRPAFYKLGFWFDEPAVGTSRSAYVAALKAEGVAFDDGFRAVHVGRAGSRFRTGGDLANATRAHHAVVALHHPVLLGLPGAIDAVAAAVRRAYPNATRPPA